MLAEAKKPTSRAKKRGTLSAQPWFYPSVAFAAYTGARREVLALRWSDVALDNKTVTIARSLTERMTLKRPKNDNVRMITISETLCEILRSHRVAQAEERLFLGPAYRDEGLVFTHADGSPIELGTSVAQSVT